MEKYISHRGYAAMSGPMLAPNKLLNMDIPLTQELFPCLVSTKYNGIRGLAMNRQWISRNGKPHHIHPLLASQFQSILNYSSKHRVVLDGEFHSNTCNTVGETRSIMAGKLPTPEDFCFKCFYTIPYSVWNCIVPATMNELLAWELPLQHYKKVEQKTFSTPAAFNQLIKEKQHMNLEGFMMLNPEARYKHGRVTIREGFLFKYKYYTEEEDAIITGLTPRKERRANIQSEETPLGYAQQSYRRQDFQETDIAGCIIAKTETGNTIYTPFPVGWSLEERRVAYLTFGRGGELDLKDEWISFRRLACESRDKPIAIKNVQLRDRK